MYKSKKGFTLSEVLITLGIIGIVAALTIPAVISSVNASKFTTALKKNLLILNSSLQINSAHNEIGASDTAITNANTLAAWFVTGDATHIAGTDAPTNLNVLRWNPADQSSVWLTDGTRLTFYKNGGTGCADNPANAFDPGVVGACYVIVDTNGDKKPNSIAQDDGLNAADVWVLGITPNSVIPVILAGDTAALPTTNASGGTLNPAYALGGIPDANQASYAVMTGAT
ncbi:MAG TPA: hypothetical protein DDW90_10170 [Cyanobacteria bacterium UBA9971]|nr:hypothetical protein [Cyanobacteria bacterium UBA9971]